MRILFFLMALVLGLAAHAQRLPPSFGQQAPDIPNPSARTLPQCTPQYQQEVAKQLDDLQRLRGVSGEQILIVCNGVESAEKIIEATEKALGKEPGSLKEVLESQVAELGKPFGIPRIDFRFVKHMCKQSAGEVERAVTTEIGRLQSEQRRCGGI